MITGDTNDLTLNLSSINGDTINLYYFVGIGTASNDAEPTNYVVDTATLLLNGTALSDYTAQTIISYKV